MAGSLVESRLPVFLKREILEFENYLLVNGVSLEVLIDRASDFIASSIRKRIRPHARILTLVGKGNNGKDAILATNKLKKLGYSAGIVFLNPGAFESASKLIDASGFDFLAVYEDPDYEKFLRLFNRYRPDVILDGLFGIGFRAPLPEDARKLINLANSLKAFKVAVDVPSGVEADGNSFDSAAFKADLTVTFFTLKLAHLFPGTRLFSGKVVVSDLGFKTELEGFKRNRNIYRAIISHRLEHPYRRSADSHKKTHAVLLIAGSKNMPGAAYLSAKSAFASGAGYVTVATEKEAIQALSNLIPEAVFMEIDFSNLESSLEKISLMLDQHHAVLIGPGLSRREESLKFATKAIELLEKTGKKAVIDGDALFALSTTDVVYRLSNCVLTPHIGEARRIVGNQDSLYEMADLIAKKYDCVCVLKSSTTVVAGKNEAVLFREASSNLATAGSGDVLAGLLAAFLTYDDDIYNASLQAVAAQALTSKYLLERFGGSSVLSSEIADSVRIVLKGLCGDEDEG